MSIKPRDTDKVLKCHISVNSYSSFFIVKSWWINVKPESKLKAIWFFSVVKIFNRKRLFGLKCIFWQPSNFSRLQPILFFRFHIFVFFGIDIFRFYYIENWFLRRRQSKKTISVPISFLVLRWCELVRCSMFTLIAWFAQYKPFAFSLKQFGDHFEQNKHANTKQLSFHFVVPCVLPEIGIILISSRKSFSFDILSLALPFSSRPITKSSPMYYVTKLGL